MTGPRTALVYGDVDLNIMDGSAIWVCSLTEALARAGVEVTVLLKAAVVTDRLVAPLETMAGVTVIRAVESGLAAATLSPQTACAIMQDLDARTPFDLVVVRGMRLVGALAGREAFRGRLWTYLTDIPQSATEFAGWDSSRLHIAAGLSRFMLCQTEELRDFLESNVDEACGRSVLWTPVVPDPEFTLPSRAPLLDGAGAQQRPLRLVYTGKFAPLWNTLEMTALPELLAQRGVPAELHMIGDKIHRVADDPGYEERMRSALSRPGVVWHGGVPRQRAMELTAGCDLGLSWRHPSMDASLELSTKVLEFGALDVPVIANRTSMHERLYGADYPLFVGSLDDVVEAVLQAVRHPEVMLEAAAAARAVSAQYSMSVAVERMRGHLDRAFPDASAAVPALAHRAAPLKVAVASHDLKFFTRIEDYLGSLRQVEVRRDEWASLSGHDEQVSVATADWADVVVCEWAGPNAVWYSRNKRPGQRLVVRLHRFEIDAGWLTDIAIDNVDQVVCVSPFYAALTAERTGWPREKIVVIPNWVDTEMLARPKLPGAQFTLGMIGIAPWRKRPDLGIDVLDELRRHDPRFRMAIKSKQPWDYWWIWRREEERDAFTPLYERLRATPRLAGAVTFDGFGGDVPGWLRRVGWVLSTSDDESFHLAPAEGMASGAVPALLPWPGADTIYDPRWIHAGPGAVADHILDVVHSDRWPELAAQAGQQVRESFPLEAVCEEWARVLVSDRPAYRDGDTLPGWAHRAR